MVSRTLAERIPSVKIFTVLALGRCFTVVPRTEVPFGYYDMDVDDYPDGSKADIQEYTMINTSHRISVKAKDQ